MAGKIDQATQTAAITRIVEIGAAADTIRGELERLLAGPAISGSVRSKKLLSYIVENALDGRFEQLKERVIGSEVFGKPANYNTGEDAIVRVAATELRRRLAEHYAQPENSNGIRIHLPSGTYIPDFQIGALAVEPDAGPAPAATEGNRKRWWPYWLMGGLLALAAADNVMLRIPPADTIQAAPWSTLLAPGRRARIVTSDTSYAAMSDLLGQTLKLSDYASYRYPAAPGSPEQRKALELLTRNQFTSVADVSITSRILHLGAGISRITVLGARAMQLREFASDDNFVLIGSVRANPWVEVIGKRAGYYIEFDEKLGRQVCRDRLATGEKPREYVPTTATGGTGEAYSVVSFIRNPSGGGHILWIGGTSMEGTESAGNFVTNLPLLAEALRKYGISPESTGEEFEILFKLSSMAGSTRESQVVDVRRLKSGG